MAFLSGSGGSDSLVGGGENDVLMGNDGADTLDGGGGWNVVAYWSSPNPVGVELGRGLTSQDGSGATDVLINIYGVYGSAHSDILLGGALSDFLVGDGGDDTIKGMDGNDALYGFAGNDDIAGGLGEDTAFYRGSRADYLVTAVSGGSSSPTTAA
jgi:Ca2+-binding RTX toxin-like protein